MDQNPSDWEQITPERLVRAIERVRQVFEHDDWQYSEVTRELCYATLHPEAKDPVAIAQYEHSFKLYRKIIGRAAEQQFDGMLRAGDPPSIFRAYFDAYQRGLEVEVQTRFDDMIKIGLSNLDELKMHPVEWAKLHLALLIKATAYGVRRWIREVCDKTNY
jgi:hypothetical protein